VKLRLESRVFALDEPQEIPDAVEVVKVLEHWREPRGQRVTFLVREEDDLVVDVNLQGIGRAL